jgi:hypothetical protein
MVACGVTLRGHGDDGQSGPCQEMARLLSLAHGVHLNVGCGLLEAKSENMCF